MDGGREMIMMMIMVINGRIDGDEDGICDKNDLGIPCLHC